MDPNTLKTYLERTVQTHPGINHSFLTRCRDGTQDLETIRAYAYQQLTISRRFPNILGSILSDTSDLETQAVLVDNLYDEYGRGNLEGAHSKLLERFLYRMGVSDLENLTLSQGTENCLTVWGEILQKKDILYSLGALSFGAERTASIEFGCVLHFLRSTGQFSSEDLEYFDVNFNADDDHFESLWRVTTKHITSDEDEKKVETGAIMLLDTLEGFYDGVEHMARYEKGVR